MYIEIELGEIMVKTLISDEHWEILDNENEGIDNYFLMRDGDCVGGIHQDWGLCYTSAGKWVASVNALWDGDHVYWRFFNEYWG